LPSPFRIYPEISHTKFPQAFSLAATRDLAWKRWPRSQERRCEDWGEEGTEAPPTSRRRFRFVLIPES
jgi:hypothetical protein